MERRTYVCSCHPIGVSLIWSGVPYPSIIDPAPEQMCRESINFQLSLNGSKHSPSSTTQGQDLLTKACIMRRFIGCGDEVARVDLLSHLPVGNPD